MSCNTSDLRLSRKIRRSNVVKAVKLLKKYKTEKNRKSNKEDSTSYKIDYHCKNYQHNKRKRMATIGFSKSVALLELQSYIAHQDWRHASNLLYKLLQSPSTDLESLMWRYLFIIILHNNNSSYLCNFIEQCIGSNYVKNKILLQTLLSLPSKIKVDKL